MPQEITLIKIKKGCAILNRLFKTPEFYEKLATYSNNDITDLIKNLSLIIDYYLTTNDPCITYDLRMLFQKITEIASFSHDYLIHPSSPIFKLDLTIRGIDPTSPYQMIKYSELEKLDNLVSFFPYPTSGYSFPVISDTYDGLNIAFKSPKILYESILKQPSHLKEPVITGQTERDYYAKILDTRLQNIPSELSKTGATIAKKVFNDYIGKEILLVIFPKRLGKHTIPSVNIIAQETLSRIPAIYLSFIPIPSYYKLLSICLHNQKIKEGTKVSLSDGKNYELPPKETKQYSSFSYSRFELISITSEFVYSNQEFTQDVFYDIDFIYGKYDGNNSRRAVTKNFSEDMAAIRHKTDIKVRQRGDTYEISNGRHRILYVKHFYLQNYSFYKNANKLDKLKKMTTLPMQVERTIEDPDMINDLRQLENADPTIRIYKIDLNHDLPEILIIYKSKIYKITNKEELHILTSTLLQCGESSVYYIGDNNESNEFNYRKIIESLILILKEQIYSMNLLDIYEYLIANGFTIDNTYHKPSKLNLSYLYHEYCDLQNKIQLSRITNRPLDLVSEVENKIKLEEISSYITEIITDNPEYLNLDWPEFLEILRLYPKLMPYTDNFLQEATNNSDFQKQKFKRQQQHKHYTKKSKIW